MKKLKFTLYKGQKPKSSVAIKLDGIQAWKSTCGCYALSRSNKPLYNLDPDLLEHGKRYEIYLGSFKETDSVLSTHDHERKVKPCEIYEIWPGTDPRLELPLDINVEEAFQTTVSAGFEGLIIDKKYKMKTIENYDVEITGVIPGKGKFKGMMGAIMTTRGRVGTGFTEDERKLDWKARIGTNIEVECMELFPSGKFRHARYVRYRWDK